jgi:hypothetical protein
MLRVADIVCEELTRPHDGIPISYMHKDVLRAWEVLELARGLMLLEALGKTLL